MVNHLESMKGLYHTILDTISDYRWDPRVLELYICAVIKHSFPLDLYTVLLRKPGREGGSQSLDGKYEENIKILARNVKSRLLNDEPS